MIFAFAMPIISAYVPAAQVSMVVYTQPEEMALGELGDCAVRPRPSAGSEALVSPANKASCTSARAIRVNRRFIRKQTWV